MRKALSITLLAAFGLAAQAPAAKAASKPKPTAAKKSTAAPQQFVIPKGAVARPDGTYAWTDAHGKKWSFVRTPFGVMKGEDTSAKPAAAPSGVSEGVKVFDAGDKVRFETPTPFGVIKREKNKADLTDEERRLFNSQNPSQAAKQE